MGDFRSIFKNATGYTPYPYQRRFATSERAPSLLSVPTGVGKTATVVLGWLWRRRFAEQAVRMATPRRLVYCLPMRTLVEQTRDECLKWLTNLELARDTVGVHVLMGGEDASDWDAHPEDDAIIIGTQDMLLSRALNRGYGMSRYRWPMQFGLLNNDCLWVLDETQLMGVGVTTSSQLAGLRCKLRVFGNCGTIWMSATLDSGALNTIDHPNPVPDTDGLALDEADHANDTVQQLLTAAKPVSMAKTQLNSETAKSGYPRLLGDEITNRHRNGTLTLVVMNSVSRSQELYSTLQKRLSNADAAPELFLIHSRFRPADRHATQALALDESTIEANGSGRIVIATQAIEAGVDISATTLFTELAPWSSLVQRFGRCNRRGACGRNGNEPAGVFWIDVDTSDGKKSKDTLPYESDALDRARRVLLELADVGPQSLSGVKVDEPRSVVHVLRRKDLLDLFDTTPDLSGNDLDVSRYIRDSDDTDLQVYWRAWDLKEPRGRPPGIEANSDRAANVAGPGRNELCSVSVARMRDFVGKLKEKLAWCWDPLEKAWVSVNKSHLRPGMSVLMHTSAGGYDAQLGWTANNKHRVTPIEQPSSWTLDAMDGDDTKGPGQPVELTQHLTDVVAAAEALRGSFEGLDESLPWDAVVTAARWHDVGKAHAAFQIAMRDCESVRELDQAAMQLWAKSGSSVMPRYRIVIEDGATHEVVPDLVAATASSDSSPTASPATATVQELSRRGFRHELVSALAWLYQNQHADDPSVNLIAYLIAAHHGKVRLSIRSMPNEPQPVAAEKKFARGIWEGDELPAVDLGNGESSTQFQVSLNLMGLGETEQGISWLARTLNLRNEYGPFRLAFLESVLRTADWRGSAAPMR